jgi:microcystin-dependent protein
MDKNQIIQLIKEELSNNYNSGVPQIPPHTHNGIDNLQINAANIIGLSSTGVPSGSMVAWSSQTIPSGWLLCNGDAVSRTTYATLFGVTGTTFGSGDGSTTFNLPNGTANVLGGYLSGDANFGIFGGTVGEATHTLTTNEIPSHSHSGGLSSSGTSNLAAGGGFTPGVNTGNTGGGAAHNNIQRTLTINWIIKT